MAKRQAIRAIIFDFGGVFTQSQASREQLRGYDALLGLPPDTLHLSMYSGEAWELASTGQITPQEYWHRVGESYAARLPAEFSNFRHGIFWAEPIDETVVALARQLRGHYRLALCSNALHDLAEILDGHPQLRDLFEVRVVSVDVGLRKPQPAIFELTARRLGLPIAACLLVDDKLRNTAAAAQLGMPGITFHSAAQLAGELAARKLLPTPEQSLTQGMDGR